MIRVQAIIPFRLCFSGPGLSEMLIHNAPTDITRPAGNKSNRFIIKEGNTIPAVIRKPSFKKRPFIKLLYAFCNSTYAKIGERGSRTKFLVIKLFKNVRISILS